MDRQEAGLASEEVMPKFRCELDRGEHVHAPRRVVGRKATCHKHGNPTHGGPRMAGTGRLYPSPDSRFSTSLSWAQPELPADTGPYLRLCLGVPSLGLLQDFLKGRVHISLCRSFNTGKQADGLSPCWSLSLVGGREGLAETGFSPESGA